MWGGNGPAVGREVVLAGPGDGERVAASQREHVGPDRRVAEVEPDPAGEPAARLPRSTSRPPVTAADSVATTRP